MPLVSICGNEDLQRVWFPIKIITKFNMYYITLKGDVESGKKGTKKNIGRINTTIIYNYINPLTFFIYSLVTSIKNKNKL